MTIASGMKKSICKMMMKKKLLILLGAIVLVRAKSVPENCNAVTFTNSPLKYEREIIKTELSRPSSLAVDRSSNTLYFSFITRDVQSPSWSAKVDLNDKEYKNITIVPRGFAQAVDNTNNEVYIGSDNGIYKYDPKKDTAELYAASGNSIWYLYFHKDLYYTNYPQQFLYVVKNGESVRVKGLEDTKVNLLVIDKDDEIFYSNETGLYGQKKATTDSIFYKSNDDVYARDLTTDNNGIVHVCMEDGVYVVNKDAKRFDKILEINEGFGIAFDRNNNLVYSDEKGVYILKPNDSLTC